MRNAGYADSPWTLMVQTYSSPLPRGRGIRYSQSGLHASEHRRLRRLEPRRRLGEQHPVVPTLNSTVAQRCRADRARATSRSSTPPNALVGHRLCENTVGLLEEKGVANWTSRRRGRQDRVGQPDPHRSSTIFGPYQLQEDIHPNYWGERRCATACGRPTTPGRPAGGTCTPGHGPERSASRTWSSANPSGT